MVEGGCQTTRPRSVVRVLRFRQRRETRFQGTHPVEGGAQPAPYYRHRNHQPNRENHRAQCQHSRGDRHALGRLHGVARIFVGCVNTAANFATNRVVGTRKDIAVLNDSCENAPAKTRPSVLVGQSLCGIERILRAQRFPPPSPVDSKKGTLAYQPQTR